MPLIDEVTDRPVNRRSICYVLQLCTVLHVKSFAQHLLRGQQEKCPENGLMTVRRRRGIYRLLVTFFCFCKYCFLAHVLFSTFQRSLQLLSPAHVLRWLFICTILKEEQNIRMYYEVIVQKNCLLATGQSMVGNQCKTRARKLPATAAAVAIAIWRLAYIQQRRASVTIRRTYTVFSYSIMGARVYLAIETLH